MLEMVIDSIRVSLLNYQRVVILKEKAADRYLPIWIGPDVADAIAVKLQEVSVPRPLTHDLLQQVVGDLGATFDYIIVSGLDHDTFFAKIVLTRDGKQIQIDSRPSDALALAVRAKVPIYAEEAVLEKAGVHLDKETGKAVVGGEGEAASGPKPVDEKELQSMSAFKDFIDSLDLDDLGRRDREQGKGGGEPQDKPDK
ncbi:MAG: bifunctional nuclease family protein [Chloroflexi bacterium]|nr:bifunctional nuclease family protein [Chloroflexota bacterium]